MKLLQFIFKALEKRKRIGRASGKTREDFVVIKAARLFGVVLDDAFAKSHLAVSGQNHFAVAAHAKHRRAVYLRRFSLAVHQAIIPREARFGELVGISVADQFPTTRLTNTHQGPSRRASW